MVCRVMHTGAWLRRRRATVAALLLSSSVVIALVLSSAGGAACAAMRSTAAFVPAPREPRVRYEPGAELAAETVAAALPGAIDTVERALGGRFEEPPPVFVCATLATFAEYAGSPRAGGHTRAGRVFISPKPENTPERLPRVLTHELVHLYFEQHAGALASARHIPPWFGEGLAALVSGAGAEQVSEGEAARAIAEGRRIEPKEEGSLFGRDLGPGAGLSVHMFYRQGAMLVGFLRDGDPHAFADLLRALEDGAWFGAAFERSYHAPLGAWWQRFVAAAPARAALDAPR